MRRVDAPRAAFLMHELAAHAVVGGNCCFLVEEVNTGAGDHSLVKQNPFNRGAIRRIQG